MSLIRRPMNIFAAVVFSILAAGTSGCLLSLGKSQNASQTIKRYSVYPTPTYYNSGAKIVSAYNDIPPTPVTIEYPLFPSPTDSPFHASWKTYISKNEGFTFTVPSDWIVYYAEGDKEKGYSELVFGPETPSQTNFGPDDDEFANAEVRFGGDEFESDILRGSVKTTIEGRTTYITNQTSPLSPPAGFRGSWCGGCSEKNVDIYFGYGGIKLSLKARWNKGRPDFEKTFDQMVATVHFTRSKFLCPKYTQLYTLVCEIQGDIKQAKD